MANLRGRVALVTGSGRGIGRAIAIALAGAGVSVGLVARTGSELEESRELVEAAGASGLAVPADLGDREATLEALREVEGAFGPIDILVNNAALLGPLGPTPTVDADAYELATVVNVISPVRLSLALLPGMLDRGFGRILNVSSGAARRASSGDPFNAYVTTKAALEAHTIGLAVELAGTGVTANVFRPGTVDTLMQAEIRNQNPAEVGEDFVGRFVERYERGQLMAPEVPAGVALELLQSDENGEIVSTEDRLAGGSQTRR